MNVPVVAMLAFCRGCLDERDEELTATPRPLSLMSAAEIGWASAIGWTDEHTQRCLFCGYVGDVVYRSGGVEHALRSAAYGAA
jgi:hypothetical protein